MSGHTNAYKNMFFSTYDEASDVRESMMEIAENLGRATMADLMRAVNEPIVFADTKFYWTVPMLRGVDIGECAYQKGYILNFPDPIHECSIEAKVETGKSRFTMTLGFYEVLFQTREEAEDVLAKMRYIAEDYKFAMVTDLKDLAGLDAEYTDNRFGWTERMLNRDIEVRWSDWGGYLIDFPVPILKDATSKPSSTEISYRDYYSLNRSDPKPVYITVNRDVNEDVDDVLKSLFKNMACLPGREFHITIE